MQLGPSEIDLKTVEDLFKQLEPIYQSESNVHAHAAQLGAACKQVSAIDEKYTLSQKLDFNQARQEILDHCKNEGSVAYALNTIAASNIEPETGLNVKELLVKSWFLAKQSMFKGRNAENLIIDNLKHNTLAGGGCCAGISARLTQPYLFLVKLTLEENKIEAEQMARAFEASLLPAYYQQQQYARAPSPISFVRSEEEDDLDYALRLSRVEY